MEIMKSLCKKRERTPQYEKLLFILYTRAWITDIVNTPVRIIMNAANMSLYKLPECIINHEKRESDAME